MKPACRGKSNGAVRFSLFRKINDLSVQLTDGCFWQILLQKSFEMGLEA
jgi:hypothetical protein